MGAEDFRSMFLYAVEQFERHRLGYVHIMDGLAFGFHERGEPMKLDEFRPLYNGLIMGNCGYSGEDAAQQIDTGNADLIAFGRPFITNPDLPARLQNDWILVTVNIGTARAQKVTLTTQTISQVNKYIDPKALYCNCSSDAKALPSNNIIYGRYYVIKTMLSITI
jgi:2,4-dienoyl-CoA reductase-like NADH-dependent reductase (Old Yellow Enzyme family)